MATTTTNIGLRKPETSDFVSVANDISGNMQTIDDTFASSAAADIGAAAAAGSALTVARTDHVHKVGSGTVDAPGLPVGESNTGLYRPGSGQLGAAVAGVKAWITSATGVALEKALAFGHVATPSAPAAGYLALYAKSDNFLYRQTPSAVEALMLDSVSLASIVPRRNRLINGCMRIAQRSTLGTADDTYTLDRWNLLLEAASAAAASQETSDVPTDGSNCALKLTVGSGEDNKFGVVTFLEAADCRDLRGKTVSLQAKLKATAAITDVRMAVLEWTGTADSVTSDVVATWGSAGTNPTLATNWAYLGTPANLSPTTSWATYKVEGLTVGASANNLAVFIWSEDESTTVTTDILRITDVKLEEGAVCTAIDRRPYAEELALCQRYYEEWGGTSLEYFPISGHCAFTTVALYAMGFTWKRVAPTFNKSAASDWGVLIAGGTSVACTDLGAGVITNHSLRVDATVASGLTAGDACQLRAVSTSSRIWLDAEL